MTCKTTTLCVLLIAIVAVDLPVHVHSPYRLIYNPSESAPRGWYLMVPANNVRVDDFVVVTLPTNVAALAAQRNYLPLTVPLLKHVSAVAGALACYIDGILVVDDRILVRTRDQDGAGRVLIPWNECRRVAADEVLLLSTTSCVFIVETSKAFNATTNRRTTASSSSVCWSLHCVSM